MSMDSKTKTDIVQGVLGIGGGFLLAFLIVKAFTKKDADPSTKQPPITAENVETAVNAYKDAVNAQEDSASLDDLNRQLAKEFGVKIGFNSLQQQFTVFDLSGKIIKTV